MPSKNKPIGIRFPPEQLGEIDAWLDVHGGSRHSAVLKLVALGLGCGTPAAHPKAILAHAEAKAAHLAPTKTPLRLDGVQVGVTHSPVGSRLKGVGVAHRKWRL